MKTTAILGTVGIPAGYGGFETLAENLVRYRHDVGGAGGLVVYCSTQGCSERLDSFLGAELRYIAVNANGPASVLYDILSLFSAVLHGSDTILLLGVSGAAALPFVRLISGARVITNVDGVEWKREKWKGFARWWLRQSERWAVRFSHDIIADNGGIAQHIQETYGRECHVIAYGGDHAVQAAPRPFQGALPAHYALSLCRVEPENNVEIILEAFAAAPKLPLVFVGNWNKSEFGKALRNRFSGIEHLILLDPIYDPGILYTIRGNAALYVHGHSAGGTNPSLVEMMHFGLPVLAYDCVFNRFTTNHRALFFSSAHDLQNSIRQLTPERASAVGAEMLELARERYTWKVVGREYFKLLG